MGKWTVRLSVFALLLMSLAWWADDIATAQQFRAGQLPVKHPGKAGLQNMGTNQMTGRGMGMMGTSGMMMNGNLGAMGGFAGQFGMYGGSVAPGFGQLGGMGFGGMNMNGMNLMGMNGMNMNGMKNMGMHGKHHGKMNHARKR